MLHIQQRLQAYQFFSQLFRYPDVALVEALISGRCRELSELLAVDPPANGNQLFKLETLEELYTGLFIARPGGAVSLYGSVYLDDGKLMGASTESVREVYSTQGLSLGKDGEPADFLSTELEFLYFLVKQEIELLAARKPEQARQMTTSQRTFICQWLLPWLKSLTVKIQDCDSGIYRWGGDALLSFVSGELVWLDKLAAGPGQ